MNRIILTICFAICLITFSHATTKKGNKNLYKESTLASWVERKLQGFDMRVWLSNKMVMGEQAWDGGASDIPSPHMGLEYPVGSGMEHLFGAGPRIGGIVNGHAVVSETYNGSTAGNEFFPDYVHLPRFHFWHTQTGVPIGGDPEGWSGYYYNHNIVTNTRGCDNDHDGKINEDDLDGLDNDGDWNPLTDDVGADGLPDSLEVSCDGEKYDPVLNPDPAQDNYDPNTQDKCHPNEGTGVYPFKNNKDIWTEKNGIPDHGEPHVDEDYGAVSDNDLYCISTDTFTNPVLIGHIPMGIKIIQKSYAWRTGADAILPIDYYFVNVGTNVITNVYVGFFADMDVGPSTRNPNFYQNNLSGYIDSLHTAYTENPVDVGSTPLGVTLLKTSRPLDSLNYIFHWLTNAGDEPPETDDSASYAWLSGSAFLLGLVEENQTQISDTRFLISFGPFGTLNPGDTIKFSLALVSGLSVSVGPQSLVANVEKAIALSGRNYYPPVTPPSPALRITPGPNSVTLQWGPSVGGTDPRLMWDDYNQLAQSFPDSNWRRINPPCNTGSGDCILHRCEIVDGKTTLPGGRNFLGYNLYRSEDPSSHSPAPGSFSLMRQYLLPGSEFLSGHQNQWDSVFVDSNLTKEKTYWYAVTSISLPDNVAVPAHETVYTPFNESNVLDNARRVNLKFATSDKLNQVMVVPNPYRGDVDYTSGNNGYEGSPNTWSDNKRLIKFIHLPKECTIRIFSLAGNLITTLNYTAPANYPTAGELEWNIFSQSGRPLASGIYIFSVESNLGTQIGKFVVIR